MAHMKDNVARILSLHLETIKLLSEHDRWLRGELPEGRLFVHVLHNILEDESSQPCRARSLAH